MTTVGSLFTGVGGFDLGFEAAGYRTLWQVEIDPWCQKVLARHWPYAERYGDVSTVDGSSLVPVDVVTFGSPCQDMSVAGARAGLSGARSGLFHEAVRIIDELRKATDGRLPAWAVWENVPGALSSSGGADFAAVLDELARIGAVEIEWRVLDARYFGVPQRRRRVFLLAGFHPRAGSAAPVLLEPEGSQRRPAPGGEEGQEIAGTLGGGFAGGWPADTDRMTFVPVASRCVTSRGHRYDGESDTLLPVSFAWQAAGKNDASGAMEVNQTPTLPCSQTLAVAYRKAQKAHDSGDCERWEEADEVNTLDAAGHSPRTATAVVTPTLAVRRLTPKECERLMGWPDEHTRWTNDGRTIADSHRYRMCGNGVVAPVAEWIGRRLMGCISNPPENGSRLHQYDGTPT